MLDMHRFWPSSDLALTRLARNFGLDQNLDFCCVFHSRAALRKNGKTNYVLIFLFNDGWGSQ